MSVRDRDQSDFFVEADPRTVEELNARLSEMAASENLDEEMGE